jgi:putative membrane protein
MNNKTIFRIVMGISLFVLGAVIILNKKVLPVPSEIPAWVYQLPALNAFLNASCSLLLIVSFVMIRRKNIEAHKKINITTFVLSSLFLVSYILYHWMATETRYPEGNPLRTLYLIILTSHIILAAIVLPLVLLSFHKGLTMQVEKHKKLVRFAFPIWLYVTITGVIVYFMISPFYPAH